MSQSPSITTAFSRLCVSVLCNIILHQIPSSFSLPSERNQQEDHQEARARACPRCKSCVRGESVSIGECDMEVSSHWASGNSEAQVLLADPEERRSFMDMRLLLVRGDMGDAESLPASPSAGLSPRRISRQEPEEGGEGAGRGNGGQMGGRVSRGDGEEGSERRGEGRGR